MRFSMKATAFVLAGAGALNWGLMELANFNLLTAIPFLSDYANIVKIAIGVSGGLVLADYFGWYKLK